MSFGTTFSEIPSDFLDNLLGTARQRSPAQSAAAAPPRLSTEETRPPLNDDSLPCKYLTIYTLLSVRGKQNL